MHTLLDYRSDKAHRGIQLRSTNAEKVCAIGDGQRLAPDPDDGVFLEGRQSGSANIAALSGSEKLKITR